MILNKIISKTGQNTVKNAIFYTKTIIKNIAKTSYFSVF